MLVSSADGTTTEFGGSQCTAMWVADDGECFVASDSTIRSSAAGELLGSDTVPEDHWVNLSGTAVDDLWVLGDEGAVVRHFDGQVWAPVRLPETIVRARDLFLGAGGTAYVHAELAEGEGYAVFRHDDGTWTQVSPTIISLATDVVPLSAAELDLLGLSDGCLGRLVDGAWVPLECQSDSRVTSRGDGVAVAAKEDYGNPVKVLRLICQADPDDCGDRECGPSPSGYGSCGACSDGDPCTADICDAGACEHPAIANDCGDEVCGASPSGCYQCGTCGVDEFCESGRCTTSGCGGSCGDMVTVPAGAFMMGMQRRREHRVPNRAAPLPRRLCA